MTGTQEYRDREQGDIWFAFENPETTGDLHAGFVDGLNWGNECCTACTNNVDLILDLSELIAVSATCTYLPAWSVVLLLALDMVTM